MSCFGAGSLYFCVILIKNEGGQYEISRGIIGQKRPTEQD